MKFLITGALGFVGQHLIDHLKTDKKVTSIYGIINKNEKVPVDRLVEYHECPMEDKVSLEKILSNTQPTHIVHLAAASSVHYSWQKPSESFTNNVVIFLNLLEAIRNLNLSSKVLSVGSSEEYGVINESSIPISENHPLNPTSPYAAARVAQEHLSKIYTKGFNIPIICTRSFNHIGPRQRETFVISSFIKQAIEIKQGQRKSLTCGNLDIVRDFVDVRDVVRAYTFLLDKGKPGAVYNICSGKGYSLKEIITMLEEILDINIPIEVDKTLIRPVENNIVVGSNEKLTKQLGFNMKYRNLKKSLEHIINYEKSCNN